MALWFGTGTALVGAGSALHVPDPAVADGDPCCPYPDNWLDVVVWFGGTVVLAAAVAALGYLTWHALRFAVAGSPPAAPGRRRLGRAAMLLAGALVALAGAAIVAA